MNHNKTRNNIFSSIIFFSIIIGLTFSVEFKDKFAQLLVEFNDSHNFEILKRVSQSKPELIANLDHSDTIRFVLDTKKINVKHYSDILSFDIPVSYFLINDKVNYNLIERFVIVTKSLYRGGTELLPVYSKDFSLYINQSDTDLLSISELHYRLPLITSNYDLTHNEGYSVSMAQLELFLNVYDKENLDFILKNIDKIEGQFYKDVIAALNRKINVKTWINSLDPVIIDDLIAIYESKQGDYIYNLLSDTSTKTNIHRHIKRVEDVQLEIYQLILNNSIAIKNNGNCYIKIPKNININSMIIDSPTFLFFKYTFKPYQCSNS